MGRGWIAVDLDGCLATYTGWTSAFDIGAPIEAMAERVRGWLSHGLEVRIFTARANEGPEVVSAIQDWTFRHFGARLPVTSRKDYNMVELWDDRAVRVESNTGKILSITS